MNRSTLILIGITLIAAPLFPAVTAEVPLSAPVPDLVDASFPAIGAGRDQMLVAWLRTTDAVSDLYVTRVSTEGKVLDQYPQFVYSGAAAPIVVAGDDRYLVLWARGSQDAGLAVIGTDGTIIHRETFPEKDGILPHAAAFNGHEFLAAWWVVTNSIIADDDIGTLVDLDGTTNGNPIPFAGHVDAIAVNGSDFLVGSRRFDSVAQCGPCHFTAYAQRIFPAGAADPARRLFAWDFTSSSRVDVATVVAHGDGYLAAWIESTTAPHSELKVMPLDRSGTPSGAAKSIYTLPGFIEAPLNAFPDGSDTIFVMGWSYTKALRYSDSSGSSPAVVLPDQNRAAAWNGRNVVVVDSNPLRLNFYSPDLTRDEAMPSDVDIAVAAAPQEIPRVATNGQTFCVIWTEYRGRDRQVYARVMSRFGPVEDEILLGRASAPSIASDGTGYMAAFIEGSSVAVQRISGTGSLIDSQPVYLPRVDPLESNPVIVWNGSEYLVVFESTSFATTFQQIVSIYGVRVTRDGSIIDAEAKPISPAGGWRSGPGVAWDGREYLVAWKETICTANCTSVKSMVWHQDVAAARFSPELTLLDSIPVRPPGPAAVRDQLSVAWNGELFLVGWGENSGLWGSRITNEGLNLDSGEPLLLIDSAWQPQLATRGASFLATYSRWSTADAGNVFLASLAITSSVQPPTFDANAGLPVAISSDAEVQPAIAVVPDAVALTYVRRAHEPVYGGAGRVFLRFVTDDVQARRRSARH